MVENVMVCRKRPWKKAGLVVDAKSWLQAKREDQGHSEPESIMPFGHVVSEDEDVEKFHPV